MKVLLVVVCGFVVLGLAGVAALVYTGYRVKKKVEQAAQERGIDLGALARGERGRSYEPCSLLTTEEATEILSRAVERATADGLTCHYFIRPPTEAEKAEAVAKAKKPAEQGNVEDLTKALMAGAVDSNTPYFAVEVNPDGKTMMAALKLVVGTSGVSGVSEKLEGIGDEAMLGPMNSVLMFVKNGTGIQIDLRQVPQGRERGIEMARRIVARM
jgi:hypothetical protein